MRRNKKIVSYTMSQIRSQDTKIEVCFRSRLWRNNIRFRKNCSKFLGKPDIVIAKKKIVIFLDSCFWHKCNKHFRKPYSNTDYWDRKIKRNITRDKEVNKYYKNNGWNLIRVWEHDINNESLIKKIIKQLKK